MESAEENDSNVLKEILNDKELILIPKELSKKIHAHFSAKFDEFITAKAVFETNRKNLGKTLVTLDILCFWTLKDLHKFIYFQKVLMCVCFYIFLFLFKK